MNGKCARLTCHAPAAVEVTTRFASGRVKREALCLAHGALAYDALRDMPASVSGSRRPLVAGGAAVAGVA